MKTGDSRGQGCGGAGAGVVHEDRETRSLELAFSHVSFLVFSPFVFFFFLGGGLQPNALYRWVFQSFVFTQACTVTHRLCVCCLRVRVSGSVHVFRCWASVSSDCLLLGKTGRPQRALVSWGP